MLKTRMFAVVVALAMATSPLTATAQDFVFPLIPERPPVDGPYPLPDVDSVPEPPPDLLGDSAGSSGQMTFQSLFLQKPSIIPSSYKLLEMASAAFGCTFSVYNVSQLYCPVYVGPSNTYRAGVSAGGFNNPKFIEMVPVSHGLNVRRLPTTVRTYSSELEFDTPQEWKGRDGSRNFEVVFWVEGQPYFLNFWIYNYGQEL